MGDICARGDAVKGNAPQTVACVVLPAFPLQLLLRSRPELGESKTPVCVVDEDKPLGKVLWLNESARRAGILPGMRYAAALSLTSELRAGTVSDDEVKAGVELLLERLWDFSPDVDLEGVRDGRVRDDRARWARAFAEEPGVFWVNTGGLEVIFPDLKEWASDLREELDFFATVVVGFSRFGTYAIAKSRAGYGVFKTPEDELRAAQQVKLARLHLAPRDRDVLLKLGVETVGELCALPPGGLRRRFGPEIHRLYRMGIGELDAPLHPARRQRAPTKTVHFDHAIKDSTRLLFVIKRELHPLLLSLAERDEALAVLDIEFHPEQRWQNGEAIAPCAFTEFITPAQATLDEKTVMDLVRLKLEGLKSKEAFARVDLVARGVRAAHEQVRAFTELLTARGGKQRDLRAADRALARLRAQFGDHSVGRLEVGEGHLPEARQRFVPSAHLALPTRARARPCQLIRRVLSRPERLPDRPRHEPDGWMLRGLRHGPVVRVSGPFIVAGGWWRREVHREYHYAETQRGAVLWVYYDQRRRSWFLHGVVE